MAFCVSRCVPIRIPFNLRQRQSENLSTQETAERTRTNVRCVVHMHKSSPVLVWRTPDKIFGIRCDPRDAGVLGSLGSYLTSALWDSLAAYLTITVCAHGFEPTESMNQYRPKSILQEDAKLVKRRGASNMHGYWSKRYTG